MSLKYGILGLLQQQPMTGYDIYQYFDQILSHMWHAQQSQVYRELNQLEREGLVRSTIEPQQGRPDKRVYSIEGSGIEAFLLWLRSYDFTESMRHKDSFALRIFFSGQGGDHQTPLRLQLEHYIEENEAKLLALAQQEAQLIQAEDQARATADEALQRTLFYSRLSLMRGKALYGMNVAWAREAVCMLGTCSFGSFTAINCSESNKGTRPKNKETP